MIRRMRIGATLLIAIFLSTLVFAGTASADPRPPEGSGSITCPDSATLTPRTATTNAAGGYLPINRWSGAASEFHTRLGDGAFDDIRQKVARNTITPMFLSLGNSMWQTASGITEFAEGFEVANELGCTADKTAADLGNAVVSSKLVLIIVFVFVILAVKTAMSNAGDGRSTKTLFRSIGILALFVGMLAAANRTAENNAIATGSPAWLITKTNSMVTDIADPVIKAAATQSPGVGGFTGTGSATKEMSCTEYRNTLHNRYVEALPTDSSSGGVPLVISALWEQSGLRAWDISQFGSRSPFSEFSSCRLLERQTKIPFSEQWDLMSETLNGDLKKPTPKTLVGGDMEERDQRMVFFGACRWNRSTWEVAEGLNGDPGWEAVYEGKPINADRCSEAWETEDRLPDEFEWDDEPLLIEERTIGAEKLGSGSEQVADYMYSLHGDTVSNAIGVSFAYFITALIMLIVLGVLAIGVIIAKVMVVVMAALSLLIIPWAAFSPDGAQKLARFAKFGVGAMIYSFALQFILILVTVVTAFLARVGFSAGGSGSIGSVIWAGISPLLAIVLIKFLFTKILRAPDPLKPSTAMAFGGAMGATGGIAMGGALDRLSRRAARAVRPSGRSGPGSDTSTPHRQGHDHARYEASRRKRLPDDFVPDKKAKRDSEPAPSAADRRRKAADRTKTPPREAAPATPEKRKAPDRQRPTNPPPRRPATTNDRGRFAIPEASPIGRAIDRWDRTKAMRRRGARLTGAAAAATWAGVGGMATVGAAALTPPGMVAVGAAGAYYGYRKVQEYRQRQRHFVDGPDPLADSAERDFDTYPRTSPTKQQRSRQTPGSPMLSVDSVVVSDRRHPGPTQPPAPAPPGWTTPPPATEPKRLWIPEQRAPRRPQPTNPNPPEQPPARPGPRREPPKR